MITYAEAIGYFGNSPVSSEGYEDNPAPEWVWGPYSGIWESDFMQSDGSMHPSVMWPGKQSWKGYGMAGDEWCEPNPSGYGVGQAGAAISEGL